jgi:hypothetical protein
LTSPGFANRPVFTSLSQAVCIRLAGGGALTFDALALRTMCSLRTTGKIIDHPVAVVIKIVTKLRAWTTVFSTVRLLFCFFFNNEFGAGFLLRFTCISDRLGDGRFFQNECGFWGTFLGDSCIGDRLNRGFKWSLRSTGHPEKTG